MHFASLSGSHTLELQARFSSCREISALSQRKTKTSLIDTRFMNGPSGGRLFLGLTPSCSYFPGLSIRTGVLNPRLPPLGQLCSTPFRENPPVDTAGPGCARRRTAPTLAGWERSRARPLAAPEPNTRRCIGMSTLGFFSSELLNQSRRAPLRVQH